MIVGIDDGTSDSLHAAASERSSPGVRSLNPNLTEAKELLMSPAAVQFRPPHTHKPPPTCPLTPRREQKKRKKLISLQ